MYAWKWYLYILVLASTQCWLECMGVRMYAFKLYIPDLDFDELVSRAASVGWLVKVRTQRPGFPFPSFV